ncbi:MAG: hypothetical protein NVSMB49_12440 [Ktedonobacteraceae bacterium]
MGNASSAAVVSALYIEALRRGQALWFRVASGSMGPLLHVNDTVRIEPAQSIAVGEIAAFETQEGLVIHRIIQRQQTRTGVRLLQMGDGEVRASWLESSVVVGHVVAIRRGAIDIDIKKPIAKWCGYTIAMLRYQVYLRASSIPFGTVLRLCSRLTCVLGSWGIHSFCRSPHRAP